MPVERSGITAKLLAASSVHLPHIRPTAATDLQRHSNAFLAARHVPNGRHLSSSATPASEWDHVATAAPAAGRSDWGDDWDLASDRRPQERGRGGGRGSWDDSRRAPGRDSRQGGGNGRGKWGGSSSGASRGSEERNGPSRNSRDSGSSAPSRDRWEGSSAAPSRDGWRPSSTGRGRRGEGRGAPMACSHQIPVGLDPVANACLIEQTSQRAHAVLARCCIE